MTPVLSVQGLSAAYSSRIVLHEVTFAVRAGEFVAVVGPNGSGKSTLLKALVGLVRITAGDVQLDGRSVRGLPPEELLRQGVALVLQGHPAFGEMTVQENLEMGGVILPSGKLRQALARVYELFPQLAGRRRQLASTLSAGEMQMLAIGRALMTEPRLVLLDEPTVGLAPALVGAVLETLGTLKRLGTSVVLVEQKARLALQMADRGLVMQLGRVRWAGPAKELLRGSQLQEIYLGRRASS